MGSPIDDVAFVARSETRASILQTLAERPHERRDLATVTGTPRSTLGRTLRELEERGWIEQNGRIYNITTAGSLLVEQFVPLLDTITVVQLLGDAIELLPREETDLTVKDFADAQFVTPTKMDPIAPFNYGIKKLHESTQFRCVARTATPQYVAAIHEGVVTGRFTAECVLDASYLEALGDDQESTGRWQEIAEGSSTVREYDEPIGFVLLVLDEIVHLFLCNENGETQGLLESTTPAVVSWANDTVDRYLERSTGIDWNEASS
ncbi:helix-turn-helix transcriptional regulator [Halalkalirubrum salinum]|uniref:helix-turn-helix transcriptional regulator n=1 Tax=Halalkalirubrum salinum TaxID=2563889 RepID=UPI001484F317|nr:helix-turn-helix domain-containing protein [Halalkalirubrum salinum]